MMLHFVFLARVVVGRLECVNGWGDGTRCYLGDDTDTCRAAEMNAAFNAGEELIDCASKGVTKGRVRLAITYILPLPFG